MDIFSFMSAPGSVAVMSLRARLVAAAQANDAQAIALIASSQPTDRMAAAARLSISEGGTPLMEAAGQGSLDCVEALLEWSNPLDCSRDGSALHWAARAGSLACVEKLLPLSDSAAVSRAGLTALEEAVANGRAECAERLAPAALEQPHGGRGGPAAQRAFSRAVRWAARSDSADMPRALRSMRCLLPWIDPDALCDGRALMETAALLGRGPVAAFLAKLCDPASEALKGVDLLGLAACNNGAECLPALLAFTERTRRDWEARAAFFAALEARDRAAVEALSDFAPSRLLKKAKEKLGSKGLPRLQARLDADALGRELKKGAPKTPIRSARAVASESAAEQKKEAGAPSGAGVANEPASNASKPSPRTRRI